MEVSRPRESDPIELSGEIAESTALKREGIVGAVGDQVVTVGEVTFRPGERTRVHEHTYGQVLYVTGGTGVVATTEEARTVGEGDLVFFPPGEPHWHGTSMDDPVEFSHLSFVIRDEVGGDTTAVGDVEEFTEG